jgi:arsenate reductase (glutaredoxin)
LTVVSDGFAFSLMEAALWSAAVQPTFFLFYPMLKVYAYSGCSTCKNALKWLKGRGIECEEIAIRETPPSLAELKAMLAAQGGELRRLFNVSGMDYRSLGLKDRLPGMSTEEALGLLAGNGNLVKRPFAIDAGKKVFLVGFKEAEWEGALGA